MKAYTVELPMDLLITVRVEAESREEAMALVREQLRAPTYGPMQVDTSQVDNVEVRAVTDWDDVVVREDDESEEP